MQPEQPVTVAVQIGDTAELARLLDAEPNSVNARGWMGITPLIAATWQANSVEAVRLLV
jgi:hypothetical protein